MYSFGANRVRKLGGVAKSKKGYIVGVYRGGGDTAIEGCQLSGVPPHTHAIKYYLL